MVISANFRDRWPGHFSGNVQVAVGDCAASRNRPGSLAYRGGAERQLPGLRIVCEGRTAGGEVNFGCAVRRIRRHCAGHAPGGVFHSPFGKIFSVLDVPGTGVSAGNGRRPLGPCRRFGSPNCADGIRIGESMSSASVEAACLNFHLNITPDKTARSGTSARKDAHSVRQPPAAIRRAPAALAGLPGKCGNSTRLSEALAETVIARHRRRKKRVRRITIDLDPTLDPTHGAQ